MKKFTAKVIATITLDKQWVRETFAEIDAKLALGSKKVFDPYTSEVYDELMKEKITDARLSKRAIALARKEVFKLIDNMN